MSFRNEQVSPKETQKIVELAQKCIIFDGDYVEMGCYRGDTSLLLAELIHGTSKKLWIYDSFEGLPKKGLDDMSALGENFKEGELFVTKREVKERFLRTNLRVPVIKKAWFSELLDDDMPKKIAFAFLDGDLYESIKDSLRLVDNKMVSGGVIVIHDYNNYALPGVKKAVNEWIGDRYPIEVFESMAIIEIK